MCQQVGNSDLNVWTQIDCFSIKFTLLFQTYYSLKEELQWQIQNLSDGVANTLLFGKNFPKTAWKWHWTLTWVCPWFSPLDPPIRRRDFFNFFFGNVCYLCLITIIYSLQIDQKPIGTKEKQFPVFWRVWLAVKPEAAERPGYQAANAAQISVVSKKATFLF